MAAEFASVSQQVHVPPSVVSARHTDSASVTILLVLVLQRWPYTVDNFERKVPQGSCGMCD